MIGAFKVKQRVCIQGVTLHRRAREPGFGTDIGFWDYQGWTDNFLMIWEEAASFQPLTDDGTPGTTTRDFWEKHFMKAVDETRDGMVLHRDYIRRAIGRNPL
ncbi:hypothetical protein F5Y01DRAFT_318724 [Xylaria sp. FL0043]|nr:hypothetical protein F5Y01DRAFT_318724 [Xylaria sp. FL0043]